MSAVSSQATRNKKLLFVAAYAGVLLTVLFPLFLVKYPALVDFPNHLARFHIAHEMGANSALEVFYAIDWALIPNIAADVVSVGLFRWFEPLVAGRVLVGLIFALWIAAPAVLYRVLHGTWSVWPLFAAPLIFNTNLSWGFVNYLLSSALAVLAFAAWIATVNKPSITRHVGFIIVATILFLSHAIAFFLYGLLIGAYEIGRLRAQRQWATPATTRLWIAMAAQAVIPIILMARIEPQHSSLTTTYEPIAVWLAGLMSPTYQYGSLWDGLLLIFIGATVWFGIRINKGLVIQPAMKWPLIAVLVLAIAMPISFLGIYYVNYRLPFVGLILLIAACRFDWPGAKSRTILAVAYAGALVITVGGVANVWTSYSDETQELVDGLSVLSPTDRLFVADGNGARDPAFHAAQHSHSASYALIDRPFFLPTLFTGSHLLSIQPQFKHINFQHDGPFPIDLVRAAHERSPSTHEKGQPVWQQWQTNFDYFLLYYPRTENPFPGELTPVATGSFFTLYRVGKNDKASGKT